MPRSINRIGIAGDIILTLKPEYQKSEFSMTHPSTWRSCDKYSKILDISTRRCLRRGRREGQMLNYNTNS